MKATRTSSTRARCRRWRGRGARPRVAVPEQHFTQPPPRFTEATLVKALEEGDRSAEHLCADDRDPARPRLRRRRGKESLFRPSSASSSAICWPSTSRTSSTSASPPRWRTSSTRSPRAIAPGCRHARVLRSVQDDPGPGRADDRAGQAQGRTAGEDCEKCGRPMVIKLGRVRQVPGLQRLPGVPQLEAAADQKIGMSCPTCKKARSSSGARRRAARSLAAAATRTAISCPGTSRSSIRARAAVSYMVEMGKKGRSSARPAVTSVTSLPAAS